MVRILSNFNSPRSRKWERESPAHSGRGVGVEYSISGLQEERKERTLDPKEQERTELHPRAGGAEADRLREGAERERRQRLCGERVARPIAMRTDMKRWKGCCWLLLALLLLGLLVAVGVLVFLARRPCCPPHAPYSQAAVAADSRRCSQVGRDILQKGGSAVDAAIATLLCSSLVHPQSLGIGGGSIYTIYDATKERVVVINAREAAPKNMHPDLLTRCTGFIKKGAQWIGVPGEVQGFRLAHRHFGKLPWSSLFEPSIQLAKKGFPFPKFLKRYINNPLLQVNKSSVRHLFYKSDGNLHDNVQYPLLAETLETIASKGPEAFYNGEIAQNLLKDIEEASAANESEKSNLTKEDFQEYKAQMVQPLTISLANYTMYTPPLPSRGAILSFILKILEGYHFTAKSLQGEDRMLTYHRIIEALKFGNGQLSNITPSKIQLLMAEKSAAAARHHIKNQTNDPSFYNNDVWAQESYGTSHLSVVDKEGNAVSVTSSINQIFGSMVYSKRTGIILNNQLADFCDCSRESIATADQQQPPSSMTPSILLSKDKSSMLVVGAAGGKKIISATAEVIMNKLWFGLSLEDAINAPRIHVQADYSVQFENSSDLDVVKAMRQRKHMMKDQDILPSVVQGIFRDHGCMEAVSDQRKLGKAAGY
ncbi:glutathione hydrolase 5 proenzyme-like [Mobula birostris]|uniref:glutathione hydrolase 5 proenzyme-like n=1 Tax=Mobula birostris TaxID=1983395 RepID=UPI003B289330